MADHRQDEYHWESKHLQPRNCFEVQLAASLLSSQCLQILWDSCRELQPQQQRHRDAVFHTPPFFFLQAVSILHDVHQHNALFLPADANCGTYRQLLPLESNMLGGEGAEGVGPVLQHGDPCSRGRPQWKHSRTHQAAEMGARLSHH